MIDGAITMEDGALTMSDGGNIVYAGSSNIFIGGLNAGTGSVNVVSIDGSTFDNGDTHTDVVAHVVQFFSLNGGIGTTNNAIETTVDIAAALAANGGIRITESDNLVIGRVAPILGDVVLPDNSMITTGFPGMTGFVASNGHIAVDTVAGSITQDGSDST